MIPIRRDDKIKLLTAGVTLGMGNLKRFMLAGDKSKADSELMACFSLLDELQNMVHDMPTPPNERPGYGYSNRPEVRGPYDHITGLNERGEHYRDSVK